MKLNHVIVVFKKPSMLHGTGGKSALPRLKRVSPDLFRRRLLMQKSHVKTIEQVQKILKELEIPHEVIERKKLESPSNPPSPPFLKGGAGKLQASLIITIGGDGTVLAASHVAGNIPILGVNSMPRTSVGFFCAANASTFKQKITEIKSNRLRFTSLPLLEVSIDGKRLPYLPLNDILFVASSPAETVQYMIQVGQQKERQRGSGVWIAAGPGSTAGICSAGGKVTTVTSRRIQYLARELYPIPGTVYRFRKGFIPPGKSIKITSEMSDGMAFLDGSKLMYPVPRGSTLAVRIAHQRLRIFL